MEEVYRNLNVGDQLEHGKLFPGISSEPIVWELIEKADRFAKKSSNGSKAKKIADVYVFLLYWHEINVGRLEVSITSKGDVRVKDVS